MKRITLFFSIALLAITNSEAQDTETPQKLSTDLEIGVGVLGCLNLPIIVVLAK